MDFFYFIITLIFFPSLLYIILSIRDWIEKKASKRKNTMNENETKQEQKQESISVKRNILNQNVADSLVVVLKWIKILIIVYIIQMIIFIPVEFASIMDNVEDFEFLPNIWQVIWNMLF